MGSIRFLMRIIGDLSNKNISENMFDVQNKMIQHHFSEIFNEYMSDDIFIFYISDRMESDDFENNKTLINYIIDNTRKINGYIQNLNLIDVKLEFYISTTWDKHQGEIHLPFTLIEILSNIDPSMAISMTVILPDDDDDKE